MLLIGKNKIKIYLILQEIYCIETGIDSFLLEILLHRQSLLVSQLARLAVTIKGAWGI